MLDVGQNCLDSPSHCVLTPGNLVALSALPLLSAVAIDPKPSASDAEPSQAATDAELVEAADALHTLLQRNMDAMGRPPGTVVTVSFQRLPHVAVSVDFFAHACIPDFGP